MGIESRIDEFHCPRCGKKGCLYWEHAHGGQGVRRDLVKIEGDFYERMSKKRPFRIELVCNGCGTAQQSFAGV